MAEATSTTESARAAATRSRILAAARTEFAAVGFGGGRIERIAALAGANKERIYAYFGDKKTLFAAAVASAVGDVVLAVSHDVDDVVELSGRVFDFMVDHPETIRLLTWARLESDPWIETGNPSNDLTPLPELLIARWQDAGRLSPHWDPHELYVVIWGLCEVWQITAFRAEGATADAVQARRRALVAFVVGVLAAQEPPEADERP